LRKISAIGEHFEPFRRIDTFPKQQNT